MKKSIYALTILAFTFSAHAQLTLQLDAVGFGETGLEMEPYTDRYTLGPDLGYGFELGYQFTQDFHLGVFYHEATIDKGALLDHYAMSQFQFIGLVPSYDIWRSSNERFGFNVGIPLVFFTEHVDWRESTWGLFTSKDSTAGRDQATYIRIGIAPALFFNLTELNLSCHLSMGFFADTRNSFNREVHYDTFEETDYKSANPFFYNTSSSVELSVRYTFP